MPRFQYWTGSAWQDASFVRRWSGSAWVDAGFGRRWSGSAWIDVWPLDLSAGNVSPGSWVASFSNAQSPQQNVFSVSPSGGTPPYTYQWSLVNATNLTIIGSATGSSVTIEAAGTDTTCNGLVRCVVTDAELASDQAGDATVDINFGTPP